MTDELNKRIAIELMGFNKSGTSMKIFDETYEVYHNNAKDYEGVSIVSIPALPWSIGWFGCNWEELEDKIRELGFGIDTEVRATGILVMIWGGKAKPEWVGHSFQETRKRSKMCCL